VLEPRAARAQRIGDHALQLGRGGAAPVDVQQIGGDVRLGQTRQLIDRVRARRHEPLVDVERDLEQAFA
jgi:hypothetical protein